MKKIIAWLAALLLLAGMLPAMSLAEGEISAKADLNRAGRRIGVSQGSAAEDAVMREFPEATIVYYTDNLLGYTAVAQGKLDAYVYDLVQMQLTIDSGLKDVHLLPEVMDKTVQITVGYSKVSAIPELGDRLNRFIAELKADGTLDDMYRRWVTEKNSVMPEIPMPEKPELRLTVGTTGKVPPYSYYEGGGLIGYDIELAQRFAAWLGAELSFQVIDFDGTVAAVQSGKVDVIMSNLQYLPERAEGMSFSDILYEEKLGILVRGDSDAALSSLLGSAEAGAGESNTESAPAYAAYNGKRIGVLTGPLMEDTAHEFFPDSEYLLFNSYPDCITALLTGKIDAYLGDEPGLKTVHAERPEIDYIHERITENNYSFAFRKNDPKSAALCEELNAFLTRCWADGTMQELDDIWFGVDEARKVVDMSGLTGENGTVRVVTTSTDAPFSYIKDGKNVGYDIDLVVRFCRYAGYALELGDVDFAARIPAIQSGRYDFTTDMNVTPEREEQVLFSDPTSKGGIVLAILSDGSSAVAEQETGPRPADWDGRRMGIITGTNFEAPTLEAFPNSEYFYYNSYTDVAAALTNNKIDGFLGDEPTLKVMVAEIPAMTVLPELLTKDDYAFAFGKNSERADKIRGQFNELLAELLSNGGLDEICAKWFGDDESVKLVDLETGYSGENGVLNVVTTATDLPFSYVKDNKNVGVCMEIVELFCRRYGYTPVIHDVDFNARIPGLVSGKFDMCASSMTITEERKESVNFSEPFYHGGIVLAVRSEEVSGSEATGEAPATESEGGLPSLAEFNGKRIGVQTGTISGRLAEKRYPNAQVNYFETATDALTALKTGKVDAWVTDEPVIRFAQIENPELQLLDGYLAESNLAAVFPKTEAGQTLCDQYSAFVDSLWADGTMEEIDAVWFSTDDAKRTVLSYEQLPATNGKLRMAADLMHPPFAYMKDGRAIGYDVDVAARFCQKYGYGLEVVSMSFGGILPAVQSGKVDFAACSITVTAERAEAVLFSTPDYYGGVAMAVRKSEDTPASTANDAYTSLAQLNGKRIGVQTGQSFDAMIMAKLPNATISYVNSKADLINALMTHKIDSYAVDEPVVKFQVQENDRLTYIPEYLDTFEFGYVFAKNENGQALQSQFNEYLKTIADNGTLQEIENRWFSLDDSQKVLPDYASFPAENGTLRMATEALYQPFSYILNGKVVGYDIDIAVRFCQTYGYGLEITDMSFDGILPSVQSGKADFGCAGITITPERAESVLFSDPNYAGGTVMAVLKAESAAEQAQPTAAPSEAAAEPSFFDGIVSSFNKTFIRENRWKLFLEGIGTTMLITVLSILFGTALGFLLFLWCRNGNPAANLITRFCLWLVQGMPMVVLLMILYYVVFGSVAISGVAVAVIGFTLTFGAAVFGMLKMGVGTIDRGQYEAAYALGHTNRHTFFKIILPQAIPHVLPAYQGEIVGLIKATAIVGYIAVQDLTKMGDIVRSRTYEAFFPLIAITVIYFVLEGLLGFAVSRIRISLDPKKRKPETILKGVNTHD